MTDLPARLAELGHDRTRQTLTIWEGVTMYLTPPAVERFIAERRLYAKLAAP